MKRVGILSVIALISLAFVRPEYILTWYARLFFVDNATPGASAILILSGRSETRISRAIELYRQSYAPRLLISTTTPRTTNSDDPNKSDVEVARDILSYLLPGTDLGLIPSSIEGTLSIFEEANNALNYSKKENFKRIILVTDSHNTKRALTIFKKAFSRSEIIINVSAAKNDIFDENNWWRTDLGIDSYLHESFYFLLYYMEYLKKLFIKIFTNLYIILAK